jgi:hypothetical protein
MDAFSPGYVLPPDAGVEQIDVCRASEELGAHGFPTSGEITCGPLELAVEPLHFSPVLLVDDGPDGTRYDRFPRALCRFETADGRSGVGWTEWNQPQEDPPA